MKKVMTQKHPMNSVVEGTLLNLPTPTSISYMWNWGSMLGVNLMLQMLTGILLSTHYSSTVEGAFDSVVHISREVNYGFMLRFMHMNGASLFFILVFIHISRSLNQSSFKYKSTWMSGVAILLMLMATAFLGYVLPWGQMSFWGATVITNLVSAVPMVGEMIVQWLWGGFSIGKATLSRFYSLHYLLPFMLTAMVIVHLASLHQTGSNQPNGLTQNMDKTPFHPFFSSKDLTPILMMITCLIGVSLILPLYLGDPENFNPANPLNTPIHIQPEWYFLFAYAILRSIPNKLGGVIALAMSIIALSFLTTFKALKSSKKFKPMSKKSFWVFSAMFVVLTYIGMCPVEAPFEETGKLISVMYFLSMSMN